MNKLNFDLKLDIYHRAQQTMALEKKLERMNAMEEELERMHGLEEELEELREVEENNQRLRESNEQLRQELDKRDQAVNEAVDLICQLESKLGGAEPAQDEIRPSTAQPPTNADGADDQLSTPYDETPKRPRILDVPDRTSSWKGTGSGRSMRYRNATPDSLHHARRTPSFLRENNGSTSALRSLYMADETKSRATSSALSKTDSVLSGDEPTEPESPRLSILSECSYLSPYGSPSRHLDFDMSNGSRLQRNFTDVPSTRLDNLENTIDEGKISRIGQWIQPQETQAEPTEQKPAEYSTSTVVRKDISRETTLGCPFQAKQPSKRRPFDSPRLEIPVFDGTRLPPTPDTMSTSNTGPRSGSNSSIIAEKSQLDQAPFYTAFALNTTLNRPRSADDVTTRPSSVASRSGSMETATDATQNGLSNRSGYEAPSMFPSYNYIGRRPRTSHIHAGSLDNPRLRSKGNAFKRPEVVEEVDSSSRRKNYATSFKSTSSEPNSIRFANADSPPLTPQDWLEAALPQPKGEDTTIDEEPELPPNSVSQLDPEIPVPSIEPAENRASFLSRRAARRLASQERLPSRSSSLRLRVSKNRAPENLDPQPRRRINLRPRFFSRSATPNDAEQVPMSDPVDKDGAPSGAIRTKILSAVRRQSVSSTAEMMPSRAEAGTPPPGKEGSNDNSQPPHSAGIPPSRGSTLRPPTSDSAEYKRRSSLGILGWMRGASSGQNKDGGDPSFLPSPATIIRAMSPDKEKPFAPSGLANSTPASAMDHPEGEGLEDYQTPAEEDESDRRPRYGQRRIRVV